MLIRPPAMDRIPFHPIHGPSCDRFMDCIHSYDGPFSRGTFIDRPNRFTVVVRFEDREEPVYLRNSGGLGTVLARDRTVLCRRANGADRKTDFDAVAVDVEGTWVTVDATLPNTVFERCVGRGLLDQFSGYRIMKSEPSLPDGGRADFTLKAPDGEPVTVEIKSNTYVVDGVSKFPDRPTERGRRQLRSLTTAVRERDRECHVVFVVQRPDVERVQPFREVDPVFADRLLTAREAGVGVWAISTAFRPPDVFLADQDVPVDFV